MVGVYPEKFQKKRFVVTSGLYIYIYNVLIRVNCIVYVLDLGPNKTIPLK